MTAPPPPPSSLPDLSTLFPWRAWWNNPTLRSWPIGLFLALVAVPPAALVFFTRGTDTTAAATVFAFYFAAAWFLLLWIAVRPANLTGRMYAEIIVVALVVEAPLALGLESVLPTDFENLASTIFAVGVPEELAKILPVAALALLHHRRWSALLSRDYLFLGAVSGLVFGAQEAIHLYSEGVADGLGGLTLVWRFVTDPISHALWAGVAGFFVGLAMQHRDPRHRAAVAGLGLAIPAVLHGVNDWAPVLGTAAWVALTIFSALLFLAYAKVGVSTRPSAPPLRPHPNSSSPHGRTAAPTWTNPLPVVESPAPPPPGWRRGPDGRWLRG